VVTLRVPLLAAIPSANTVRATFTDDAGIEVVTTMTHQVPRARITIEPTSGPVGTTVTLRAEGFRHFHFRRVTTIEVGGIDVTPSPNPVTNLRGDVTFDFIVPGLRLALRPWKWRFAT
jgi:hypothetical protein